MVENTRISSVGYACPKCKRPLQSSEHAFHCGACNQTYPMLAGIPNFVPEDVLTDSAPNYRWIKLLEFLAPVYEGALWHSFILSMAGARGSSLSGIEHFVAETLNGVSGTVLDAACGPATYGRRMAALNRSVHGIDFSMGTLQQGLKNIAREGLTNIRLARASVETLPFENAVFDGAICGGALHLFPDTLLALREIARTLKPGAPLAVTTFLAGKSFLARRISQRKSMHAFTEPQLQKYITEAGFESFTSKRDGDFLMFSTCKALSRT